MREIKFRAWDKSHKIFWYELPVGFELKLDGRIYLYDMPTEEMELSKFTGLQDKKGNDIYENDVIKYYSYMTGDSYTGKIEFRDACFCVGYIPMHSIYSISIIGNIYENPEYIIDTTQK